MVKKINDLVNSVRVPARYVGGEYGIPEMKLDAEVTCCFCVPDSYEVGMSNLGSKILYHLFNTLPQVRCERCYAPWQDYADYLHKNNLLLSSLETDTELKKFDFVAFSFQFELGYSNFLYMLDLSGIPFCSRDRDDSFPLVVAGGPCCVNPEPVWEFVDFFFVGEGEDIWPQILNDYADNKGKMSKTEFLHFVDEKYSCIYVPQFHSPIFDDEGKLCGQTNPKTVVKYKVKDLDKVFYPVNQIVPNVEVIHDRAVVELFRGCYNGCRFCQAGYIYRPVRLRSASNVLNICENLCNYSGYDELSLNSLSSGDYPYLPQLLEQLRPYATQNKIQLNLPSLRLDSFEGAFTDLNRKSSLTFAPEAGTQRLRDVINKNITEDNIFSSVKQAFQQGFSTVKLYFMIGLPTETMEDIEGIVDLTYRIRDLYVQYRNSEKGLRLSVSASTFIPKPFTPFQWEAFDTQANVEAKQKYLRSKLCGKSMSFSWHDYTCSTLEAVLARGGRELSQVLLRAYKLGAKFDAWGEYFDYSHYLHAFEECGVDVDNIVGSKSLDQALPWDFISVGVDKDFLKKERERAYEAQTTPACNKQCNGCGLKKGGFCL